MVSIRWYATKLGVKVLALAVLSGWLAAYLVANPSTPDATVVLLALGDVFVLAHLFLSTVDEFVRTEYGLGGEAAGPRE